MNRGTGRDNDLMCPDLPKANPKSRMKGKSSGLMNRGTQQAYDVKVEITQDKTG